MRMMRMMVWVLLAAGTAWGQERVLQSTLYTRDWLRATNAGEARTKLALVDTNVSVVAATGIDTRVLSTNGGTLGVAGFLTNLNARMLATGGAGTEASPWTGWESRIPRRSYLHVTFPQGVYSCESLLFLATEGNYMSYITLEGEAGSVIKGTGRSTNYGCIPALTVVGFGNDGTWMYGSGCKVKSLVIDGSGTAHNGLFFGNVHDIATEDVRPRNCIGTALRIDNCWTGRHNGVLVSNMRDTNSYAVPTNGVVVGGIGDEASTCQCFQNVVVESCLSNGIYIAGAAHCRFDGGTAQFNTNGVGIRIEPFGVCYPNDNWFIGMDLEVNGGGNVVSSPGTYNSANVFMGNHVGTRGNTFSATSSDAMIQSWGFFAPNASVGLIAGTNAYIYLHRAENGGTNGNLTYLDAGKVNYIGPSPIGASANGSHFNLTTNGPSSIGPQSLGTALWAYAPSAGVYWWGGSLGGDVLSFPARSTNRWIIGTVTGNGIFGGGSVVAAAAVTTNWTLLRSAQAATNAVRSDGVLDCNVPSRLAASYVDVVVNGVMNVPASECVQTLALVQNLSSSNIHYAVCVPNVRFGGGGNNVTIGPGKGAAVRWTVYPGVATNCYTEAEVYVPTLSPTNCGGACVGWWTATGYSTNTTPVLTDWSGNGNDLTNLAAAATWPTRQAGAVMGQPALSHAGGQYMQHLGLTAAADVFAVCSITNGASKAVWSDAGSRFAGLDAGALTFYGAGTSTSARCPTNQWVVYEWRIDGTNQTVFTNGVAAVTVTNTAFSTGFIWGEYWSHNAGVTMKWGEVAVYSAVLDAASRSNLMHYATNKYWLGR